MTGALEPIDMDDAATPAARPAVPAALARIQRFVNTLDEWETRVDELEDAGSLATWLAANGLARPGETFGQTDVIAARAVRGAIRELLIANAGGRADPAAIAVLDDAGSRAPLNVRFDEAGNAALLPAADGLDAVVAALLADIAAAIADGTWTRLKVCRDSTCRWAYYDASKNRSRRWCAMAECGNRMKGRTYRARARQAPGR